MHVAHALGIPAHKVVGRTKRLGGGFGGKETRAVNVSVAAAVPAWHLRRPVRLILDRDEDMHTTGHRHAFLGKYKVRMRSLQMLLGCCKSKSMKEKVGPPPCFPWQSQGAAGFP